MSDVKRYIVVLRVPNDSPFRQAGDSCLRSKNAEVVLASDYDALAADHQRLSEALEALRSALDPDDWLGDVSMHAHIAAALAGSKEGK